MPAATLDLRDGTVGYLVRHPRRDDCWAAAVATTLEIPIDQVPDSRLHERRRAGESVEAINCSVRQEFERWLTGRGLRMVTHRKVPAARARWIGIVPGRGMGWSDHSMVMSWGAILFDPTRDVVLAALSKALGLGWDELAKIQVRKWGPSTSVMASTFRSSRPGLADARRHNPSAGREYKRRHRLEYSGHTESALDDVDLVALRRIRVLAHERIVTMRQELAVLEAELEVLDDALRECC